MPRWSDARRDAADALVAGVALQSTVLLTGVLAARMLGPDDRGMLAVIWILVVGLAQLGTFGVPSALTYFVARGRFGGRRDVRRGITIAGLQAIALLGLQAIALVGVDTGLITIAALPAMVAQLYGLGVLQGLGRIRLVQVLRVLPTAAYAVTLTAAFLAGSQSLTDVTLAWTAGYVTAALVTSAATLWLLARAKDPGADRARTRELMHFGTRATLGAVSPLDTFRVDQLAVGLLLSMHSLGLYVVALAFTNLPRFVAQGVGQAVAARVAGDGTPHVLWRYVALAAASSAAIAAPLALLSHPLVELFFGAPFAGAAPIMVALQAGTVLICVRRVLGDGMRAGGLPAAASLAELVSFAAFIPLGVIGMTAGGALGIAWALTAASGAGLATLVAIAWHGNFLLRRLPSPVSAGARP